MDYTDFEHIAMSDISLSREARRSPVDLGKETTPITPWPPTKLHVP
jgi:hypothetical protein